MLWYKHEKYYCEYMYCLFAGKRGISVENITFYHWKSAQNIKIKFMKLDNFVTFDDDNL